LCTAALQAAEKVVLVVILSEPKDLLFRKSREKADSSGKPALGMTILEIFRSLASRDTQGRWT
jgi:hypothetical protein